MKWSKTYIGSDIADRVYFNGTIIWPTIQIPTGITAEVISLIPAIPTGITAQKVIVGDQIPPDIMTLATVTETPEIPRGINLTVL